MTPDLNNRIADTAATLSRLLHQRILANLRAGKFGGGTLHTLSFPGQNGGVGLIINKVVRLDGTPYTQDEGPCWEALLDTDRDIRADLDLLGLLPDANDLFASNEQTFTF